MWSILESVFCALEKNVYSAAVEYNVLHISIIFIFLKYTSSPKLPPYWFFVWIIYTLLKVRIGNPNNYCIADYFSLKIFL